MDVDVNDELCASSQRRAVPDRRKATLRSVIYGGPRRRRRIRREADRYRGYYTDWYSARLFLVVLGILILSATDAAFTLVVLERGGVELNPFMGLLIDADTALFAAVKLGITGLGVVFLVAHVHFRLFRALKVKYVLFTFFSMYISLAGYQLTLLSL